MTGSSTIQILIGGPAGSGNITSGLVIARALHRMGYYVIGVSEYPSLIRGGHTAYWVRAGVEEVWELEDSTDYVIAFDEDTIRKHGWEFREDTVVIYDDKIVGNPPSHTRNLAFPFRDLLRRHGLKPITMNMMAVGAIAGLMGIPLDYIEWSIRKQFAGKEKVIGENLKSMMVGYEYVSTRTYDYTPKRLGKPGKRPPRILVTGNEAISTGFVAGGLHFYVAYPMTPASPILHYMVQVMKDKGIPVIQAESEIAAAQMALAATWAGIRAATATSGGGFALMNETLSEAGMFELPLIIVLAMRHAPSTGLATHNGQGDLLYTIFAGHGEFPRIVVAPTDQGDAYYRIIELLNLTWKYRVPGILLEDKHLAESSRSVPAFREDVKVESPALVPRSVAEKRIMEGWEYRPYMFTEDCVPPWVPPGTRGALVKSDSSEHDERGIYTEDPVKVARIFERRMCKEERIRKDLEENYEVIRVYGAEKGSEDIILLTWGSSTWAALEASKHLAEKGVRTRVIQVIYLWPFPRNKFVEAVGERDKPLVTVEYNYRGQLGMLARMETGIKPDHHIGKYDGRPFRGRQLAERILEYLKR